MRRGWDALKWLPLPLHIPVLLSSFFLCTLTHSLAHKTNQSVRWSKTGMYSLQNSFNDKEQVFGCICVSSGECYVMSVRIDGTLCPAVNGFGQRSSALKSFSNLKAATPKTTNKDLLRMCSNNNKSPSLIYRVNWHYLEERKINLAEVFPENWF